MNRQLKKKRTPIIVTGTICASIFGVFTIFLLLNQGPQLIQASEMETISASNETVKSSSLEPTTFSAETEDLGALYDTAAESTEETEYTSETIVAEELVTESTTEVIETPDSSNEAQVATPKEPEGLPTVEETEAEIVKEHEAPEITISYSRSTDEFIQLVGTKAQIVASQYDLYASVMIAQSILESASGNSGLSREPNYNLFGIKGSYEGNSVTFSTQEDDGNGKLYTINASFRKYPSYYESLEDYGRLLQSSFYAGARKSQAATYEVATQYLTGRYATDINYNQKLNALIRTYDLTRFDGEPSQAALAEVEGAEEVSENSPTTYGIASEKASPYISTNLNLDRGQKLKNKKVTANTPVESVMGTQHPYLVGGR